MSLNSLNGPKSASEINGFGWLSVLFYGTSYFSHPIVKYTFFTENSDLGSWHAGGGYNFPIIGRVVSIFQKHKTGRAFIRDKIAEISTSHGYTPNPWSTGIRDIVIDFGYFGSIIFMFFFLVILLNHSI